MDDQDQLAATAKNMNLLISGLIAAISRHRDSLRDIDIMAKRGTIAPDQAVVSRLVHQAQLDGLLAFKRECDLGTVGWSAGEVPAAESPS